MTWAQRGQVKLILVNNINPLRTATYTLDTVGNRTQVVVDAGVSKTCVPDLRNRYMSVRLDKIRDSLNADEFGYSYDAASNQTQRLNYYNSVAQVYGRDAINRMTRRDLKIGTGASFAYEAYGYNTMNQILSIDREDGKRDLFGYNFAGELTSAKYGMVNIMWQPIAGFRPAKHQTHYRMSAS